MLATEQNVSVLTSLKSSDTTLRSNHQTPVRSVPCTPYYGVEKKGTSKLFLYFFGATGIEATRHSTLDYYYCLLCYSKTVRSRHLISMPLSLSSTPYCILESISYLSHAKDITTQSLYIQRPQKTQKQRPHVEASPHSVINCLYSILCYNQMA